MYSFGRGRGRRDFVEQDLQLGEELLIVLSHDHVRVALHRLAGRRPSNHVSVWRVRLDRGTILQQNVHLGRVVPAERNEDRVAVDHIGRQVEVEVVQLVHDVLVQLVVCALVFHTRVEQGGSI